MTPFYAVLLLLLMFLLLMGILFYFGIATTKIGFGWLMADFSFPTRWEGCFHGSSGLMRRNFVVFKKYSALSIEIETASGSIDFDVKGPDGSSLSPASAVYGRDASVLIDVSRLKRCTVALNMRQFDGRFRITLQ